MLLDFSEIKKKNKKSKNGKSTDDADKDKPKDDIKPVGFFTMFRYSTNMDRLLYFIGFLGAIVTGLTTPLNMLIFGDLTNVSILEKLLKFREHKGLTKHLKCFQDMINLSGVGENSKYVRNEFNSDALLDAVQDFSLKNTYIGIAMLICSYISVTCFNYAAHSQILAIRSKFFKSILHQDMSWYDFNQSGEVASRMNE